jgi:hypothetical protein
MSFAMNNPLMGLGQGKLSIDPLSQMLGHELSEFFR